jgi:bifunctional non-homologous end joining protein LigD
MADLKDYNKKRDFRITSEPAGKLRKGGKTLAFCVQKHDATRLHYDFRLELDGVLKSWAVTKGPSFHPGDKRLAVHVEDHPYDYRTFEGVIPAGQYGGGPVMLWDEGWWEPVNDPHEGMKKGHLTFILHGGRMKGEWALIRMHGRPGESHDNWLLVKADKDEWVQTEEEATVYLDENNTSIKTGRTMEEIFGGPVLPGARKKTAVLKRKAVSPAKVSSRRVAKGVSVAGLGETDSAAALQNLKKNKAAGKAKDAKGISVDKLTKTYPSPQLATLVEFPPLGPDWRHEIKYDGYRIMPFIGDGKVVMRTRGGLDWTEKFSLLAAEIKALGLTSAVLDGEIVALNDKGASDFSALKTALSDNDRQAMHLFVFDILHLNGEDLHKRPLRERQAALAKLLNEQDKAPHIHLSESLESDEEMLPAVCKLGGEGIVSKRVDAPYSFRRNKDWVKSKCGQEQEFVIGGFVPASNDPKMIGALYLGFYRNGQLSYAGKVGTGYTHKMAADIYKTLKPLASKTMPFTENAPKGDRNAVWVEPSRLCEVKFWEWTPDRHIRHASFKGLREDKAPREVVQELPEAMPPSPPASRRGSGSRAAGASSGSLDRSEHDALILDNIHITHPDRVMFPDVGVTKGEVAQYYHDAMPYLLPFLEKRPISVIRFPGDITGEAFFQRNPMKGVSREVQPVHFVYKNVKRTYFYIDSPEGLMSLVQMGTIEFHPWGVHVNDVHHPDQLIFDLDPDPSVPFEAVKLAALDMRGRLKKLKLESFVRTTGGKGLHVIVPILPRVPWAQAKDWCRAFCENMVRDVPDAYIANMSKAKRSGKIFLDFFRNDYTATAVTGFVIRGRKGAPIAVPLAWKEIEGLTSADRWNIRNIRERFDTKTKKLIAAQLACQQDLHF